MTTLEARNFRRKQSGWAVLTEVTLATAGYAWSRRQRARRESAQADRVGRTAEQPQDIPARGWKEIAWRVWGRIGEDRILVIAAGIVFYGILALFPAIAALVSIYGMFASPVDLGNHLNSLSTVLPGGAIDVIKEQMTRVASNSSGALGVATIVGLLVALWSANAGMKAMYDGLNVAYHEKEKRSFIQLNISSLVFTLCMIGFALLALGAMVALPYLTEHLGFGEFGKWAIAIGKWPVLLVLIMVVFACLYRFGPSRDEPQWRWITPGSIVGAVLWLAASILFSWYAANFGSYNKTYGSLGAVIGFMTWMWISTIVVILGGILNAETEQQTDKDTTVGRPQPIGARGAYAADVKPAR
jgi:membrane protein